MITDDPWFEFDLDGEDAAFYWNEECVLQTWEWKDEYYHRFRKLDDEMCDITDVKSKVKGVTDSGHVTTFLEAKLSFMDFMSITRVDVRTDDYQDYIYQKVREYVDDERNPVDGPEFGNRPKSGYVHITTPLLLAVANGAEKAALFLIERGAYLNVVDPINEETVLSLALRNDLYSIVNTLLDYPLNFNVEPNPFEYVGRLAPLSIIRRLQDVGFELDPEQLLFNLIVDDADKMPIDTEVVDYLFSFPLDLERKLRSFFQSGTLLQVAIKYNKPELVLKIIQRGVDLSSVDSWGQTYLQQAAETKNNDIVKLLLDNGYVVTEDDKPFL